MDRVLIVATGVEGGGARIYGRRADGAADGLDPLTRAQLTLGLGWRIRSLGWYHLLMLLSVEEMTQCRLPSRNWGSTA
jgi:hypothetical protein